MLSRQVARQVQSSLERVYAFFPGCLALSVRLSPSALQTRWRHFLRDIEAEQRERRKVERKSAFGAPAVLTQRPHTRPKHPKESPRPACMASDPEVVKQYLEDYRQFVNLYRELLEQLLNGHPEVLDLFPDDCFIPPLAYHRSNAQPRAPD